MIDPDREAPDRAPRHGGQRPSTDDRLSAAAVEAARQRRFEMQHLQEIEGNPLSVDQIAMFEMF